MSGKSLTPRGERHLLPLPVSRASDSLVRSSTNALTIAVAISIERFEVYESLRERARRLESEYPWLTGDEESPVELPKGILNSYQSTIARLDAVAVELQEFPNKQSRVLNSELEILKKKGELVTVTSVVRIFREMAACANRLIPDRKLDLFKREASALWDELIRENSAAAFVQAGEQQEAREADKDFTSRIEPYTITLEETP